MTSKLGPLVPVATADDEAMTSGKPWDVPGATSKVEVPPARRDRKIADAMLGAYFGLAGEISTAASSRSPTSNSPSKPGSPCMPRSP